MYPHANPLPTFACPHCGYGIPSTIPAGTQLPCPSCRAAITAPAGSGISHDQAMAWAQQNMANQFDPTAQAYQAAALQHGNAAAARSAAQGPGQDPRRANFSATSEQVVIRDAEGRYLVIGSHVDQTRTWCLRAQCAQTGTVVWETPRSFGFQQCPGLNRLAARDGVLLVVAPGGVHGVDTRSGQLLWHAQYHGEIQTVSGIPDGSALHVDVTDGVLLAKCEAMGKRESVLAIDLRTGQVLWQRHADGDDRIDFRAIPDGVVAFLVPAGVEIAQARTGAPIANLHGDYGDARLVGPYLAVAVDDYGADDKEGMLLCDPKTGNPIKLIESDAIEVGHWRDDAVQMIGNLLVAKSDAADGGRLHVIDPNAPVPKAGFFAKLFGGASGGYKGRRIPGDKVVFGKLQTSVDAICIHADSYDGDNPRLLVLDPQTLGVRFDSGKLPFDESDSRFETQGNFVAYVVKCDDDGHRHEVRMVNTTTGQPLWARPIGDWNDHWFTPEGFLVVYHDQDVDVFRAADGQVVGGYPLPRQ